jgi:hypothetical protein
LLAEAAALGDNFTDVTAHPADLVADAEEMLEARADLAELKERRYAVSEGLLKRIELLRTELAPMLAEEDRAMEISKAQTEAAESARLELLDTRRQLALIGAAAGLPSNLFSLETSRTTRLNVVLMKMEEVLANVGAVRERLADPVRVDGLVTRAGELIDSQKEARADAKLSRLERKGQVRTRNRLMRLLYDAMIHLSAQGLAAYPGDATREGRYRLDHVYGRRPSLVKDPGAGGETGVADAAGPAGEQAVFE